MKFLKAHWPLLLCSLLVALAVALRLTLYGNPRLSIANNDTITYVRSSEVNLFSWDAFTAKRLYTTNLIYNLLKNESSYEILVNGSGDTTRRRIQPGFTGVALFQVTLAVAGWGLLALVFAGRIKNPLLKITGVLLILLFAFTPPLADWDSLLTSESLTFSLFALQLSLLILLAFRLHEKPDLTWQNGLLLGAWGLIVFLWTFVRDTNLYILWIDLLLILGLLFLPAFRKQKYILGIAAFLIGLFVLGWASSMQSIRSIWTMREVYQVVILPSPANVQYMQTHAGMPPTDSPEWVAWFDANAKDAYIKFLLAHPGYVATVYFKDALTAFADNTQPYFNANELPGRDVLLQIGDAFHPESPLPFFMDFVLLLVLWLAVLKRGAAGERPWAWLATWIYLVANINLFIVIFGDSYGLIRHALMAVTAFRLFTWMFTIVLADLALTSPTKPNSLQAAPR